MVDFDGFVVGDEDVVVDDLVFVGVVVDGGVGVVRGVVGGEVVRVVVEDGGVLGFVEGDLVFVFGDGFEEDVGVVFKVGGEFFFVEEVVVVFVEGVGEILVEEGDEGGDVGFEEVVDEFDVVVKIFLVDGVVVVIEGDDVGLGDGEVVGFGV